MLQMAVDSGSSGAMAVACCPEDIGRSETIAHKIVENADFSLRELLCRLGESLC
jgi:hypothetical protein